ncbi:MAG TPA: GcrA family cell cycle regulator [Steroidobacteraceae bacterium]|nr:GcrA family cell cycle regulator [Steroidobacteraceae bacterium]
MAWKLWPPEKIEQLRALAAKGLTSMQAAMELGCTKNIVIGQATRANPRITWLRQPKWPIGHIPYNRKAKPKPPKPPPVERPRIAVEIDAPQPRMLGFLELNGHCCHWPYGTGPYLFCATDRINGETERYCAYHKRLSVWHAK